MEIAIERGEQTAINYLENWGDARTGSGKYRLRRGGGVIFEGVWNAYLSCWRALQLERARKERHQCRWTV